MSETVVREWRFYLDVRIPRKLDSQSTAKWTVGA